MPSVSDTLILGTHKGLVIFRRNGKSWRVTQEAFPGIPVSHATVDPRSGTLWACLDHGHWGCKLHRSRDGGASWEEIEMPRFPPGAEIRDGQPASITYIWLVAPGGQDQPERLYMGTEPGGLFVSDDGGDSFSLLESLWNHPTRKETWFGGGRDQAGICAVFVDPRDSNRVLVDVSVGGVFETTDGGHTWQPRNKGLRADFLPDPHAEVGHDPHFLVAAPSDPDVLWQQNHCGVFRSADGAQTWQDISQPGGPVHFGFAIAADPHDASTAWVVPATSDELRIPVDRALCVCRTEDGGQSWQDFRAGLPQEHCYDLVFRHALDISGERLAFGTTTGNLFLSDDRGENWTCIHHHLPMVYSVRFAPVS